MGDQPSELVPYDVVIPYPIAAVRRHFREYMTSDSTTADTPMQHVIKAARRGRTQPSDVVVQEDPGHPDEFHAFMGNDPTALNAWYRLVPVDHQLTRVAIQYEVANLPDHGLLRKAILLVIKAASADFRRDLTGYIGRNHGHDLG